MAEAAVETPTVLVIEDGPYIGSMVRTALQDEGYRVVLHASGRGGLAAVKQQRPNVIVLDLMLPDVDGDDVLRELKKNPETADIPVVVMSAVASTLRPEDRLQVEAVVRKPFDLDELFTAIKRAIG